MKTKKQLVIYELLSFIVMLLPIIIIFIVKWEDYTKQNNGFSLAFGGICCVIFCFLLAKGKFKMPTQNIFTFAIFFMLVCILEPLLKDLKLISCMALLGQILYTLFFEFKVKKLRKQIKNEELSEIITSSIKKSEE